MGFKNKNMKIKTQKTIGILGGMGPQATSYLYNLIIKKAIKKYGVINNDDFPDIVIFSVAVPDFISSKNNQKKAFELLKQKVLDANKIGISCLSIACNTAHLLLPELEKHASIPFVSMIKEVAIYAKKLKLKKVGLLGTPTTLKSNLYQGVLAKYGIKTILPKKSKFKVIGSVIRNVIAGIHSKKDRKNLLIIAQELKEKGAQAIILGCTELPLVFPKKIPLKVLNSLDILAEALLKYYY